MLAAFTLSTPDRAGAQVLRVECVYGTWILTGDGVRAYDLGGSSGIPCTEPRPGWRFSPTTPGAIEWISVSGPPGTESSGSQPAADIVFATDFLYEADENNRALRADDGLCYREQHLNSRWRRSGSYGPSEEACRKASWNAYYRSQRRPLVNPGNGQFESGWPPGLTIWSSTLTVDTTGDEGASRGCSDAEQCGARLTSNSFTYEGATYLVESLVYDPDSGSLTLTLDQELPEELTLRVGDLELVAADGDATDEGGRSWTVDRLDWAADATVSLRLTT
ncbi:MAG: hypothetical protein OXH07_05700 [Chloroflexi bacterium]|nr:hypothetical protein [Chloroflexota bacterium]